MSVASPPETGRVHRPLAVGAVAFALVLLAAGASLGRLARDRIYDTTEHSARSVAIEQLSDATLREARYRADLAARHVEKTVAATRAIARHLQRLGAAPLDQSAPPLAFAPLTGYQLPGFFSGSHDVVGISPDPAATAPELSALAWRGLGLSAVLRTARAQVPQHTRIAVWVRDEGLIVHPAVPAETFARWLAPHPGFGPKAISPFDPTEMDWLPQSIGPVGRRVLPYVVPLLDGSGAPWAVVRCDVDLDELLTAVGLDVAGGAEMQPLVLDRSGSVLAAASGAAQALGLHRDDADDLAAIRACLNPVLGETGYLIPHRDGFRHVGRNAVFAGVPVDGIGWTLGVAAPRYVANAAATTVADDTARATDDLANALLGFSGLFGLLAALTSVGFALVLRRRLGALVEVARAHAAGHTDTLARCDGDDEIGAVAISMNATALRANETVRRLDESRRRLSGLIESMGEGLVITDSEDRVTFANTRFSEILQRPSSSLSGHFLEEYLIPQSLDAHRAELARRHQGTSTRMEATWRSPSGPNPQTIVSALPLFDADGRYTGSCGVVTDITTRARAQEESARTEKLRALGEMAGGVAHDFNNVLTAVLGNTQYLLSETIEAEVRETLRIIETAALDGTETVNRIRKFTKPSMGIANAGPVDPNSAAHDVLRMAQPKFERVAQQRGARYDVNLLQEARRHIRGNASEVREVLLNLAYNALEAMPDGGSLTIETFDRGEDSVGVRIADSGRGIPDEHLNKIFDPFFSTKRGGRCSGLGLSICFGIVRAHGGRIEVRSEPGVGTTFTVVLPAFDEADQPEQRAPRAEPPQEPRVLLVSTQRRSALTLQRGLKVGGLHVAHVHETAVATDLLSDPGIFNTLLVELDLGAESGWDLARASRLLRSDLRIVLMTTPERPVDDTQMRNAGIDRALCRPFDSEDVRSVILSTLAAPAARLTSEVERASRRRDASSRPEVHETWGLGHTGPARDDALAAGR